MLKKLSSKEEKRLFGNKFIKNPANTSKSTIKNVDLDLEVEMDDGVHEILASPHKHKSTLLDVTILKQKNLDSVYQIDQSTMNSRQTRDFITNLEFEKHYKKKLIDKILKKKLSANAVNKIHVVSNRSESKICLHSNSSEKSMEKLPNNPCGGDRVEQIFTSPRTYNDLFVCKNKTNVNNEKIDAPCTCKNCALFGLVQDSQKRPYNDTNCRANNKNPTLKKPKSSEDVHNECKYYFKYLSMKIKYLEARLAKHEERAVPKDYFRKIVTKLVNHLGKINHEQEPCKPEKYNQKTHKYMVHTALNDDNNNDGEHHFCKWGEDILKPGIDLKNKIQHIVDEQLNHFKTEINHNKDKNKLKGSNSDSTIFNFKKHFKKDTTKQRKGDGSSELSFNIDMSDDLESNVTHKNPNNDMCKKIK